MYPKPAREAVAKILEERGNLEKIDINYKTEF